MRFGLPALVPTAVVLGHRTRGAAAGGAAVLAIWLNLWWLLPLVGVPLAPPSWQAVIDLPRTWPVYTPGYALLAVLALIAVGAFTPAKGSPRELAARAARRGDWLAAGEFLLQADRPGAARRAFTRARAFARAGEIARSRGNLRRAASLFLREGGDALAVAAPLLTRLGRHAEAASSWQRFAQHVVEAGRPEEAIEAFLRGDDTRRALRAAEIAVDAARPLTPTQVDAALRAARAEKRPSEGARIAAAAGRFAQAGDLFLAADRSDAAADAFRRAGDMMRAAEALRLGGRTTESSMLRARHLADTGKLEQAAAEYDTAGMRVEAAEVMARLGKVNEAVARFRAAGEPTRAAETAREHGDHATAARLFAESGDWEEAGVSWRAAGRPVEAAVCFERAGDLEEALATLEDTQAVEQQARLLARVGRVEEAFARLYESGRGEAAWALLSRHAGTFPSLAPQLEALAERFAEQGEITTAISAVQRATAGLPVSRETLPALYVQASLLERHGDLRAADAVWRSILAFDYAYRDAAQRLRQLSERRGVEESSGTRPAVADATDRYILEEELGRGGMGVVYRARDTRLHRVIAIKILHPHQHTEDALRRFEREARSAAALSHPGIVHVYDFDRGFGSTFIAMELVSGQDLNQLLRSEPAFVRSSLPDLLDQIADAVAYAHARQVVHRDLKPANMVLADRLRVKILDFGIARRLDDVDQSSTGATGTPFYMAPEQIVGEDPDTRTDIYSLGVTFFQLATGMLPFAAGNVLRAHLEQPPPDPRSLAPGLSEPVSHLILDCLAKEPDQRPRDGTALLERLRAAAGGRR